MRELSFDYTPVSYISDLAAPVIGSDFLSLITCDINHPTFSLKNVIFTPHSGADTIESVERMGLNNIADIDLVLGGEQSPRVLNKEIYV